MKPERQNQVIAEICGYKPSHHSVICFGEPTTWTQWTRPDLRLPLDEAPNYHGDLNACHEMEKTLTGGFSSKLGKYFFELNKIGDRDKINPVFSTSAQRCEAFIRVHGKWEEE